MSTTWIIRGFGVLLAVLALLLVSVWFAQQASTSALAPPPEVQGQSFTVVEGDPLTTTGVHPADILGVGGNTLIPCLNLGLLCIDPVTGDNDDLNSLSYGWDFVTTGLSPVAFSVTEGSQGAAGTAVRVEANCSPAEPQADVFGAPLDNTNAQELDGDGVSCSSNSGFVLVLTEGTPSDDLDNLDRDPCQVVDINCDGLPEDPVFFTLTPGSPSLAMVSAGPADILIAMGELVPLIWASGTTQLGLKANDVIDALCIRENGDGVYDREDEVLFSLSPASPTLADLSAGPADLLRPGPAVVYPAAVLGLQATDDVDALVCAFELAQLYLPLIRR
jgi:hypothetical protein